MADCAEDALGGLIDDINAANLMDCADTIVLDDATNELIAIAICVGNYKNSAKDAAGGQIADIDAGAFMIFSDMLI